jgi:hypothetical protein
MAQRPRRRTPKRKQPPKPPMRAITPQEALLATKRLEHPTANLAQVGAMAGMSAAQAGKALQSPQVRTFMAPYLDAAGAGMGEAAKVVAEGLKAMETKFFAFEGKVKDKRDVVNWQARLKAAEMAIAGHGGMDQKPAAASVLGYLEDHELEAIRTGKATLADYRSQIEARMAGQVLEDRGAPAEPVLEAHATAGA